MFADWTARGCKAFPIQVLGNHPSLSTDSDWPRMGSPILRTCFASRPMDYDERTRTIRGHHATTLGVSAVVDIDPSLRIRAGHSRPVRSAPFPTFVLFQPATATRTTAATCSERLSRTGACSTAAHPFARQVPTNGKVKMTSPAATANSIPGTGNRCHDAEPELKSVFLLRNRRRTTGRIR